jgi:hypothetical protein
MPPEAEDAFVDVWCISGCAGDDALGGAGRLSMCCWWLGRVRICCFGWGAFAHCAVVDPVKG